MTSHGWPSPCACCWSRPTRSSSPRAASEALALVSSGQRFDVVVCDLQMPGTTGMDIYTRLREQAPALAERLVFMSGGAYTPAASELRPHRAQPGAGEAGAPGAVAGHHRRGAGARAAAEGLLSHLLEPGLRRAATCARWAPRSASRPDTTKKRTVRPRTAARKKRSSGTDTMPLPMATTLNGVGRTEHSSDSDPEVLSQQLAHGAVDVDAEAMHLHPHVQVDVQEADGARR